MLGLLVGKVKRGLTEVQEYLRRRTQRELLAQHLETKDDAFSAEEINGELPSVGRATIYRTLELLVQAGLARRIRLGKEHSYYEHILGREAHEHMICMGCDRIIEWLDPELTQIVFKNCSEQNFSPIRHSLRHRGCCATLSISPSAQLGWSTRLRRARRYERSSSR